LLCRADHGRKPAKLERYKVNEHGHV
jgi:hypothetical protein